MPTPTQKNPAKVNQSRLKSKPLKAGKAAKNAAQNRPASASGGSTQSAVHVEMDTPTFCKVLDTLQATYHFHPMGELTQHDPYKVLVACILSLRTKDEVTMPASERLFELAQTPQQMIQLTPEQIAQRIYPVGFYKTKAQTILDFSHKLLEEFNGLVPNTIEALLTLKGVGRKTANLVVGLGYGLPAICVDIHVHRISNRLGYLVTKTPDETEMVLRGKLPLPYWHIINTVMVLHGQQTCRPIGPLCDQCPVADVCLKVNVKPRVGRVVKAKKSSAGNEANSASGPVRRVSKK